MSENPAVTVIIPVFNGQSFIKDALRTVAEQQYQPLEIIVVDDGSTDETVAILKDHPQVNALFQENAGPSAARNLGIQQASSDLITFLDVDDLYPPDKLQWQAAYLMQHRSTEVVVGGIKHVLLNGTAPARTPLEEANDVRAFVNLGASMFRRSVFERIGLFAEEMRYSEDVDWFFRALEGNAQLVIVKKLALLYQLHADSLTHSAGEAHMRLSFLRALQRSVERRRLPNGEIKRLPDWMSFFEKSEQDEMQLPVWKDT